MNDHERCKHIAQEAIAEEEVEFIVIKVEDTEARSADRVVIVRSQVLDVGEV